MKTGILDNWNIDGSILLDSWSLNDYKNGLNEMIELLSSKEKYNYREQFLKKELTLSRMKKEWVELLESSIY